MHGERRSFSKLKYAKNRLRTTMTNERVTHLSLMSIEYDILRETDFDDLMMMILGVSPLRGFPVERRGIGHLVPILCGRRLAGLVRLGGGVCPSAGCPVGTVVQLVGPAPTLHGALGGRQASAGYGPASGASVSAQPSAGRTRAWWPHRDTTSRWCGAVAES